MARRQGTHAEEEFRFEGFKSPRYTQVPDEAFDVLMARLTPAEFKVMMYIIRRTFGFKKDADAISLQQLVSGIRTRDGRVLDSGTGLSKSGVVKAIRGLLRKNVIKVVRRQRGPHTYDPTLYALNVIYETPPDPDTPRQYTRGADYSVDTGSTPSGHVAGDGVDGDRALGAMARVHQVDTQDSETKGVNNTGNMVCQEHSNETNPSPRDRLAKAPDGLDQGAAQRKSTAQRTGPMCRVPAVVLAGLRDAAVRCKSDLLNRGVSPTVAEKLLRTYPIERIQAVLAYLDRAKGQWEPHNEAAWIVSALREGYVLDNDQQAGLKGKGPAVAEKSTQRPDPAYIHMQELQQRLGVGERDAATWRRALSILRSAGHWTPWVSSCFLKEEGRGRFVLLVPRPAMLEGIRSRLEHVRHAVSLAAEHFVSLDVKCLSASPQHSQTEQA